MGITTNVFAVTRSITNQKQLFDRAGCPFHLQCLVETTLYILRGITSTVGFHLRDKFGYRIKILWKVINFKSVFILYVTIAHERHFNVEVFIVFLNILNYSF
jgi:hypothetical protein